MMSTPNISIEIDLARRGDTVALSRLLEQFRNYLHLLGQTSLPRSTQAKIDASDVAQETLFKAHTNFAQFRGSTEQELAGWLRQILANHLADQCRRYRVNSGRDVAREVSLDLLVDRSSQCLAGLFPGGTSSPSQQVSRRERSVLLANILAGLPDDQRQVIVLRSLQELDWKSVAEQMNQTEGAARMLWVRALRQIRPLAKSQMG